ncbi:unnamed protein product [Soboliphyme baturini]|uniref:Potassium voltage-gated channel subfamily H member 2 n=1 Tax=Soboliphyme baturini TaxID=241478 RepID=A0A183IW28_9BILA|nr:unnamed protein product [Soboliphyme baturini]
MHDWASMPEMLSPCGASNLGQPCDLPSESDSLLGSTIQEKTRRILGWTYETVPITDYSPLSIHQSPRKTSNGRRSRVDKNRKAKQMITSSVAPYPFNLVSPPPPAPPPHHQRQALSPLSNCPLGLLVVGNNVGLQQKGPNNFSQVLSSEMPLQNGVVTSCTSKVETPACTVPSSYKAPMVSPARPVSNETCSSPVLTAAESSPAPASSRLVASAKTSGEIFEMLRQEVPNLSQTQNRFRTLIEMVASVMELESQLKQLKEETRKVSGMLNSRKDCHSEVVVPGRGDWTSEFGESDFGGTPLGMDSAVASSPSRFIADHMEDKNRLTTSLNSSTNLTEMKSVNVGGGCGPAIDVPDDLISIDVTAFKTLVDDGRQRPTTTTTATADGVDSHCGGGDVLFEPDYSPLGVASDGYKSVVFPYAVDIGVTTDRDRLIIGTSF